jgi:pSer/pThr/pTyr-binding forkhead associated (FHA) protein
VPSVSYALRFISGKYQGGEFPLHKGREIVIGRSSELEMVLIEDMVSRRHAAITVNGDELTIADVGSTNGTFVNGEKVKRARLKEGDRVLIGTSIMKVVTVDPANNMTEAEAKSQLEKRGQQQMQKTSASTRAMTGNIEEIPLPDLLQLFSTSKRTGVLTVNGPNSSTGQIYLRKGQLYYATIDDSYEMKPDKAAYRILTWDKGTFELDSTEEKTFLEEIKDSTEGLLMEAMRIVDEMQRLDPELPPRTAQLTIPKPLVPALSELNKEQLEVFQVVLNGATTQGVLDKSRQADCDAAQALVDLIKKEYMTARS